ncbi:CBS domain-containing protein [Tenggerimyces flavus]|uniref:HPP family protein n=1 Tax=Tenggerimyces flavus TaxID=1708749 RepID=A0ABV7YK44_9ACTN|nr:CBS domain-containing protein [Tenggerimyces flavus]MBM7789637.1 CBS domain-containing protein [Tenggerimyces flavus]
MEEPTVADAMTHTMITASADTPFKELVGPMVGHGIGGLPVTDPEGRPIGVVLASDLLTKFEFRCGDDRPPLWSGGSPQRRWRKSCGLVAKDLMSQPQTVKVTTTARVAAHKLATGNHRMLCVVDKGGYLVGVVTGQDLVRLMLRSDSAVRHAVERALIAVAGGTAAAGVGIDVADGVVTLEGSIPLRSTVLSIGHAVHRIRGVVLVRSTLRYEMDDLMVTGL